MYERKCDNRMRVTASTCSAYFASLLELFRKPNMQTQYGHSQEPGLGSIKNKKKLICFLFCTAWVVVLQNTNASKAFFHRGVITVHHWCLLFLSLLFTVHVRLGPEMSDLPSVAPIKMLFQTSQITV